MFQDHGPDQNPNLNPLQSFKIKPLGTPVFATRQVTHKFMYNSIHISCNTGYRIRREGLENNRKQRGDELGC